VGERKREIDNVSESEREGKGNDGTVRSDNEQQ
jgi:hypothetical protein